MLRRDAAHAAHRPHRRSQQGTPRPPKFCFFGSQNRSLQPPPSPITYPCPRPFLLARRPPAALRPRHLRFFCSLLITSSLGLARRAAGDAHEVDAVAVPCAEDGAGASNQHATPTSARPAFPALLLPPRQSPSLPAHPSCPGGCARGASPPSTPPLRRAARARRPRSPPGRGTTATRASGTPPPTPQKSARGGRRTGASLREGGGDAVGPLEG